MGSRQTGFNVLQETLPEKWQKQFQASFMADLALGLPGWGLGAPPGAGRQGVVLFLVLHSGPSTKMAMTYSPQGCPLTFAFCRTVTPVIHLLISGFTILPYRYAPMMAFD
jgi:hypothetical protein